MKEKNKITNPHMEESIRKHNTWWLSALMSMISKSVSFWLYILFRVVFLLNSLYFIGTHVTMLVLRGPITIKITTTTKKQQHYIISRLNGISCLKTARFNWSLLLLKNELKLTAAWVACCPHRSYSLFCLFIHFFFFVVLFSFGFDHFFFRLLGSLIVW